MRHIELYVNYHVATSIRPPDSRNKYFYYLSYYKVLEYFTQFKCANRMSKHAVQWIIFNFSWQLHTYTYTPHLAVFLSLNIALQFLHSIHPFEIHFGLRR